MAFDKYLCISADISKSVGTITNLEIVAELKDEGEISDFCLTDDPMETGAVRMKCDKSMSIYEKVEGGVYKFWKSKII